MVVTMDVGQLASVGRALDKYRFQMKRGHTLTTNEFWGLEPSMTYDAKALDIIAKNTIFDFTTNGPSGGAMQERPSFDFKMTTKESEIDAPKIVELIEELGASCGNS